jgi:DNA adenine methylase
MIQIHLSPLRYPGGKASIWKYLKKVIEVNKLNDVVYIEPFAGGAGAALNLLINGYVNKIILNDIDSRIIKFWKAILNDPDAFIAKIISTPVNISEWKKQKTLLRDKKFIQQGSDLDVGFASFFLNRCNRSGILSSGPIGGMDQSGNWKIDARFNKAALIQRIENISKFKNKIKLYNEDGVIFLKKYLKQKKIIKSNLLVYLDPPYYQKGRDLYKFYMQNNEHTNLGLFLKKIHNVHWILSYDDISFIRKIYKGVSKNRLEMQYSANKASMGKELLISSDICSLPQFSY